MSLFAFARPATGGPLAADLVAALDTPAALVRPDGQVLGASPLWHDRCAGGQLPQALAALMPADGVFRVCRAVRLGRALREDAAGMVIHVRPLAGGALVQIDPATPVATSPDVATATDAAGGDDDAPSAAIGGPTPVSDPAGPRSQLAALVAAAPLGIARLDRVEAGQARVLEANAAFVRLAGPEVEGPLAQLFAEGDRTALASLKAGDEAPVALALASGRSCEAWLLADGQGGAALLAADVSARREMEQRLVQSSKMEVIGNIAAGVAHELNNMLGVVALSADELLIRHPIGDPSFEELQNLKSHCLRASNLVATLLAYSRQQTVRREALDVGSVLSEFRVLLKKLVDERISLDFRHGRGLPPVLVDRQQFETVIMNLVTNARDAVLTRSGDGGAISVVTRLATTDEVREALAGKGIASFPDTDWVEIAVTDTGTGMPPEVAAKIFDLFFTTKPKGQGTGIGMASVYGIVKGAGGFIALITAPGEGTTFRIFLPGHHVEAAAPAPAPQARALEAAAPPAPPPAAPVAADLSGRGRILIADDEAPLRTLAARILRQRGYEVVEACDGEEALDILMDESGTFDLLLSDVKMPGMGGPELLKEARPYLGRARVIFMSGYAEQNLSDTLESDREISFLQKPFGIEALSAKVKAELAAA
jgi:two-component system, cell cycle sensor histidine kinase and response regulator CckA